MQFTVPKFIDQDPKIVGPFTFKEFAYLAVSVGLGLILYFALPLFLFLIAAAILMSGSLSLIFLKPNGRPLPVLLKNLFVFLSTPKIYLWKKKQVPLKIIEKKEVEREKTKERSPFKIVEKSLLKKLSYQMEIKQKSE